MTDQPRQWRKSSYTGGQGNCVEVAWDGDGDGGVAVRDSKDPGGPVLSFPRAQWQAFLAGLRTSGA